MARGARAEVIRSAVACTILTRTSGFIAQAGFTHSLTPARNCTFGCTYCYVPTMRVQGGLQPEDWHRWGQFTTIKSNAAELLAKELRPTQKIYCSPLVDPYQPTEAQARQMPGILAALADHPPEVFVIQTRGPLIERDLQQLKQLSKQTILRISFSLTTNREEIRRLYEPHCATYAERLASIRRLRECGLEVYSTLAPLLPCDPEQLAAEALEATGRDLIGDPLHVRVTKLRGATTKESAFRISEHHGHAAWFDPEFQQEVVGRIRAAAKAQGHEFGTGPEGFALLTRPNAPVR